MALVENFRCQCLAYLRNVRSTIVFGASMWVLLPVLLLFSIAAAYTDDLDW